MSEREEGKGIKARGDKTGSEVPATTRGPERGTVIQGGCREWKRGGGGIRSVLISFPPPAVNFGNLNCKGAQFFNFL